LFDAAVMPLAALATALLALGYTAYTVRGAGVALTWTVAALLAAAGRRAELVAHLLVAGTAAAFVVLLALPDDASFSVALLSVHAVVFALVMRRQRASLLALPAVLSLVVGSTWAYRLLAARPVYGYPAFLTPASAVALAAVSGWLVFGHIAARVEWADMRATPPSIRALVASSGALAALGWGYEELAHFHSREVSTSILAFYFAACGVATILVGRHRAIAGVRQVGLILAVYAALKAVIQVSSLPSVAPRIAIYLLVGCFLLAVAYWYRDGERVATGD
jgi:hypothetical protein